MIVFSILAHKSKEILFDQLSNFNSVISVIDNWSKLSNGMLVTKNQLINDSYWSQWKSFLENIK